MIEIIVVIVLISLVFGVVARGVFSKGEEAKAKLNLARMEKVKSALNQYRFEYGTYPASLQDLVRPSGDVQKSGKLFVKLVDEDELRDLFGSDFIYKSENDNRSYTLTTLGADGKTGGEGADQDVTMRP
ncbi:MAG: type II secretion system protein GspG [Bdellovibrionales bacterium]|nr:type II secretion system protein GspG [Bdellovibrionales bacterium]